MGGRVLRRQDPATQIATASQQTQQRSKTRNRTTSVDGAEQKTQPAHTQAGLPRQCMEWTGSMNKSVMRIMYRVTRLGQKMRVADQYQVILRNNLITETRQNNIKQEVEQGISQANSKTVLEDNNQIAETLQLASSTEAQMQALKNEQNQKDNAELRDN
ncbi:hypothetical protein HHI36_008421 [Cryptolaemus montrouzieri]|uniref:Uncharacterized protein n=1 Tax=Cryptolaemus montrouzieri TaxID=559131 RepID=A0ABD2MSC3_9CUCU